MNAFKRLLSALVIVLAGIALTACNTAEEAPTASETPSEPLGLTDEEIGDLAYLKTLRDKFPELAGASDEQLVSLGKETCRSLEGMPINEDTMLLVFEAFYEGAEGTFSRNEVGYFYGAATSTYCPDTYDKIVSVIDGPTF